MTSAAVFRALADPTRRQILQELGDGELSAGEIVSLFEMSAPSVSRHLSILLSAGLVETRREANKVFYRLRADELLRSVNGFLSAVCPTQILAGRRIRARRGKA